jgi:MFS family permease
LSAYWFAVSLKWFVLLTAVLPAQVSQIAGEAKAESWGTVVFIGALWALLGPALFGSLSDRVGKWRPFVAMGAALTTLALFVLPEAKELWHLILGYLLLQVSDDMAQGPYAALIPGLVPEEQRGRASGIMGLLSMSAQIVGGIGAFLLSPNLKAIYILIVAVTVFCAVITLLTVRETPPRMQRSGRPFLADWIEPWKSSDFRWVWFTRFANAIGFYLIYNYLQYFLSDVVKEFRVFGITVAPIGQGSPEEIEEAAFKAVFILALVISLFGALGAVLGGRMADKVGRKRTVYLSGALMALPVIPFIFVKDFTIIALLALPFAVGYGAYQASDWALAADVMPDRGALAKDMGIWQSCVSAPQLISGGLGAAVAAGNRSSMGLGYSIAFGLASVAFIIAVVFVSRIRGST